MIYIYTYIHFIDDYLNDDYDKLSYFYFNHSKYLKSFYKLSTAYLVHLFTKLEYSLVL